MSRAAESLRFDPMAGLDMLAALLGRGLLVLEGQGALLHADAQAMALFGMASPDELKAGWPALVNRQGLELDGRAFPASFLLTPPAGGRRKPLRAECYPLPGSAWQIVLLREEVDLPQWDQILIGAAHNEIVNLLAASAAHDLSGSLNNLQFALVLLKGALARQSEVGTESRVARHLQMLEEEQGRMLTIVRSLPDRLAPPASAQTEPVDLGSLLQAMNQQLRHESAVRRVRCRYAFPPEPIEVPARRAQLMLALQLTMASLLELCAEETEIEVGLTRQGEWALLRFEAAALPLPPALMQSAGLSASPDRRAIAMQAARMIVAAHGGQLDIAATGEAGTRVGIDLPAIAASSETPPANVL